jgi:hypothetical protein
MKTKPIGSTAKKAAAAKSRNAKRRTAARTPASSTKRTPIAAKPSNTPQQGVSVASVRRRRSNRCYGGARGAAIADLTAATGWQEHSFRAARTGLRKAGHAVARERHDDGETCYRIGGTA